MTEQVFEEKAGVVLLEGEALEAYRDKLRLELNTDCWMLDEIVRAR